MLYVIVGLGESLAVSSLVLAAVAGGYVVAAVIAGALGRRLGIARVIVVASAVYGIGFLVAGLATEWSASYLPVIFAVAIAGGLVMTLAWGLLYELMPEEHRGTAAGLATWTKGFGLIAGPLLAGAAIDILAPVLEETQGYQVLWPLCGIPILLAIPLVASLIGREERSVA